MNTRATLALLAMVLTFGCTTASNADKYTPVNSTMNQTEIAEFLSLYNQDRNSSIRQTPQPLHFTALNSEENSFSAILCDNPKTCTTEELTQREAEYTLQKADINNDGIDEFVLIIVGQGNDLVDVVLGVYQQKETALLELPYKKTRIESFGYDAIKNWPSNISQPFVTRYHNENYMNFQTLLVWKDKKGEVLLSADQLDRATTGTIEHYRYLWKGDTIQQIDTYEQSFEKPEGP